MELHIDDLVFTKKGKRAMELAVITEIRKDERVGRFGTLPLNTKMKYIAEYSDGKKLIFNQGHINHTVFVVA